MFDKIKKLDEGTKVQLGILGLGVLIIISLSLL
jgi:hypothetical protein